MKFPSKKSTCPFLCWEDILLGLRYAYYINNVSAVPDMVYDKWEKKCLGEAPKDSLLRKPGSDRKEDYSDRVRALGMYFTFLMVKKEPEFELVPKKLKFKRKV